VINSKVVGIISSMREEWAAIVREDQNCHTEYEWILLLVLHNITDI